MNSVKSNNFKHVNGYMPFAGMLRARLILVDMHSELITEDCVP